MSRVNRPLSLRSLPAAAAASILACLLAPPQLFAQHSLQRDAAFIQTVTVSNPGNPDDTHGYGGVDYIYEIGAYEVTAAQYTVFLNAVAAADPYRLYNLEMWTDDEGCRIERLGEPGAYHYRVAPDWAQRPVNFVSWGDAARFANWLHNGRPRGPQDLSTTEDGAYFINGALSETALLTVTREADATWALPSEDEWYKAAYHANDGATGNYFSYPTSSSRSPSHELIDPDPGNNATHSDGRGGYTIGAPYYRTPVGAHENSAGPYGTFDQGGNVLEWNEANVEGFARGARGGSWFWGGLLHSSERPIEYYATDQFSDLGFRVARIR